MKTGKEKGSQPIFGIKVDKDVYIEMRDGVRLCADIYHPDAVGKFPALLSMSPYDKDKQNINLKPKNLMQSGEFDPKSIMELASIEAGISEYFVSRGYVHVIVNVRGTFKSEGKYQGVFSPQEQEDGYDLVEWIAQQPWCNGNVGMVGISYFAVIQYLVASMKNPPPHLKAIFPLDGFTDLYRDLAYHGGICTPVFPLFWFMPLRENTRTVPYSQNLLGKKLEAAVQNALNSDAIKSRPELVQILKNPEINPVIFDLLLNPTDGPLYWERSSHKRLRNIKIPTYTGSDWSKVPIHLRGAFTAFESIKAPKKMLIGPPEMVRPFSQYHDVIVRWYDYWLKGIDNKIINEPPVKIFVQGVNQWREENEWPLARTEWTKYYLHNKGVLDTNPPSDDEKPDSYLYEPINKRKKDATRYRVRYETLPLAEDTEVTGPIALYLYALSTDSDPDWIVRFEDISSDGTKRILTRGWLKASHRDLNKGKSKPWQPYHPHTKIKTIKPDKVYQYAIEILPTSNVFKKFHKIGLEISSDDGEPTIPPDIIFSHLLSGRKMTNTVFHNPEYPSHLILPIIPTSSK
ncbi:MAG: CocE/NonD family hydrolase [Candidatus Jordarchaeum sp.]|uniref:CocE/NonD family hydrolase n=1 Tax=Candidatus Jordarchaeum sp. TaxID=2823881 RepID=UPI004049EBD8